MVSIWPDFRNSLQVYLSENFLDYMNLDSKMRTIVIGVVTALWTASIIDDILNPHWDPSPFVHYAMMAVVGWATADKYLSSRGSKKR